MKTRIVACVVLLVICGTARAENAEPPISGTAATPAAKLEVRQGDDSLAVDTGAVRLVFDTKATGGLRSVAVGKKDLVSENRVPPLAASLIESATYDGWSDHIVDARRLEPAYRLRSFQHRQNGRTLEADAEAELTWPGDDAIRAQLHWAASAGSPRVGLSIRLAGEGRFANRFVRELAVETPLALNFRKRVVMGGDQGRQFDCRHFYQFHLSTRMELMSEPEHNWWRCFMVEQPSAEHFRAWRAESPSTASLMMQHGYEAPGWIAAYDQQGGVLWAYRQMPARAPKAVACDAEKAAVARVYLHPPTARAIALDGPQARQSLLAGEHQMDWVWFEGEFPAARPTAALADAQGVKSLASDVPAKPKILDLDLWNAPAAQDDRVPLVAGGLPMPQGAIQRPDQVRLFKCLSQDPSRRTSEPAASDSSGISSKGQVETPLQARALAFWPDGSIKWLLLVFPLDGRGGLVAEAGSGEGQWLDFHVTLRQGPNEPFRLLYGKGVKLGSVKSPLEAAQQDNRVTIRTGPLELSLGTGRQWLGGVSLRGRSLLRPDAARPPAFVDFLRTDRDYPVNTSHASGALDPGPLEIDSLVLEEQGPLRATVRLEGMTKSKEPQRVILRVEAYAGRSAVRLFHSVEFLHKDPRRAMVRSMGLTLPLELDPKAARIVAGTQTGPRRLDATGRTGLSQPDHVHYDLWQQAKGQRSLGQIEHAQRCRGWISLADRRGGCTAVVRNMWQEYPKEIVAEADPGRLTVCFWPESHPVMDVRRYSNYPHPSQGESVSPKSAWVDETYYPNDPFVGVSKTHEVLLLFHDAELATEQIDAAAADFQSPPLVYATPAWYASLGIAVPHAVPDGRFPRVEANLENVTRFWLFHQKVWAWYGMWDYGDVRHAFRGSGYGRILPPDRLALLLKMPAAQRAKTQAGLHDYHTQEDWALDNGRWGWGNTEGLPGLFLQTQYLRTGRRELFFAAEAMARHTRDVDMRHDGRWFGEGTRHGVQHWSDGNHEERQTVHSEWRFIHYLTGDMRYSDFAGQLTDRHYTRGTISVHAAHSGRLYGLLTRWEMTGDAKLGEMLKKYVHCFIVPEGIAISPTVQFPEVNRVKEIEGVNDKNMFFHTFGGMHALIEYYQLTHDAELKAALIRLADVAIAERKFSGMFRKVVTFAALHAADPKPYRAALVGGARSSEESSWFNMVSDTPRHWTGPTAYLRPSVISGWFWLGDVFYLLTALDREPEPTARQLESIAKYNEQGHSQGSARESWQSEYDRPDLAEYLRDRRGQPPAAVRR